MNLIYVAGRFPKTSESFVLNEVLTQLDAGHGIRVVSLRPPERDPVALGLPRDIVVAVPRLPLTVPFVPTSAELAVPDERPTRKAYATVAARWIARSGLAGFEADIVHAHFANLPALVAGHLSALLKVPYTFMPHATDYRRKMSDRLLGRRVRHADGVFVISHAAGREIARRAALSRSEADALRVVRASVRAQVDQVQAPEPSGQDRVRFVSIARHVPMKGLDLALRAFAEVRRRHPAARFDLVGDGPETGRLRALVAALDIGDAVTFHGRLDNREAQQVLATGDIAVLPCRRDAQGAADGLPVFLMEAGALAVPAVTTPVSGIGELVEDGRGGLVVPSDDLDALVTALTRLADDAALRRRLGEGLQARVRHEFDRHRQVQRLCARWAELVDRGDHRHGGGDIPASRAALSVVVVARDEADVIERCVAGASWADEVLVAVDGTTADDTAQRARDAGATVHAIEWRGFSATKNDAAKLARHDWILSLDADEAVSRRLRHSIEQVLRAGPDPRDGFAIERRSDFLGTLLPNDTRAATRRSAIRLYHRAHGGWDERMAVHEVVRTAGRTHPLPGIIVQWRDFDLDELLGRFNRYATIEARQMATEGRRAYAIDVALRPLLRFGWHYVGRGEALLGGRGLVHSGLKAASEYMRWAKLWELQRRPDGDACGNLQRALRDS